MNAVQYIKNVGKSFGYIAVDTLKDYNPAITSTISQAKDLSSDLYQYVKDIKSSASDRMSKSESSLLQVGKDTISDLWKNTKSDLMTGNFYNKARKDEAENAMMESMFDFSMDDFNFDDDFGDFDFDDDMGSKSADPDDNGLSPEIETQVRTTEAVIRSMDSVGYAMSGSINRTNIKTAEYIVAAQERSSRALYDLSNRGFKQINIGLGAINANMTTLATLAQPLTTHMQNSATFYTNTSEFQKKTLELLGKLVENTSPIQTQSNRSRTKGTIGDLMSGGILDVRAYAEYVGGNVKDIFSLVTDMIGLMGGAKSTSKNLTASPISSAMKMALQGVMPKVLKESMKDFNEMLEGVFQTALGSMESKNWGIFEILKEVFVPKSDYKSKLNTSRYHKGKVDWDGKSRKALLEVIPRYLAEISSALTGKPMQIYDFDAGRFKTVSTIEKEWTDMYQNAANSAGSDLRSSANNILGSLVSKNKISEGKRSKMMSEIESYLLVALQSGDNEFLDIMKDNFNHIKYGLSNDSVKLIRSIFKYTDSHKNRRFRSRTMGGIYEQRNRIGNRISDIEADGSSIFNVLFDENPEKKSSLLLGTDKDGNDIFFYLRGIYENTMGGGGRGRSRRSRNNKPSGGSGGSSATSSSGGSFTDIDDGTLDTLIEESFTGDKPYFPNRELEEYYYNKKANPNYPINDDLEEELEKWIKMNNAGKDIKARASKNPVINKVLKTIGLAGDMLDKATVGISNMIDSASKTITEFVYGENGTIGLFETIKGLFTDFRGTLRAMFGRGRDYFFGENGKLRPFMNSVGDNLKSAKDWLKNRFTGTASNGRRVTRSGMVSVSEGEMIIPAELNPYYHGSVNKRSQRRNELRNAAKFYGFYNDGGIVGQDGVGTTAEESVERTQEASVSFIKKILEKIFPNNTKGESKKVQDVITKALDTLKGKGGAMGAGALVGTGVSLFTGGMISPILGAGLGAAAGLIIKSKEIQTALFGDEEKDGMMGHHISEFVKKHLPSVATGSAVGLAGGLFLGSPVMGAILGGAVGYVNSSIQAKEFLFGSDELDSGIISKEFQKKFKQNLPKMALGATASLALGGPFGLAGNIILGAAAGYATDVDKAKKWLLGDDEQRGFFTLAKENFFNPLVTIFDNLAESLRHTIRDAFHGIGKAISNRLANSMKRSRIAGAVGNKLGQWGAKLYNGTWGAIGGTMHGIANSGTRRALRKGYMIRDRKSKSGYADANARTALRQQFGEDEGMVAGFDSILSRMETEAEYDEMLQGLQSMYNGTTGFNRQRSNYEKDAARNLEKAGVDKATARAINKAMHDRDYDTAMRLAEALPDTPAKRKVIGNIKAQRNYNSKIEGVDKARADLAKKLGVRPEELNDSTLANFMDLTRNEAKSRSLKTNEQVRQRQVEDAALKVPTLLEKILTAIINPNSHGELSSWLNTGGTGDNTPREGDNKELNGEAYEYRNGIWVNKEEHEIKSKFMRTITDHFPRVGSALEKIDGAFTNLKQKLFGNPDNENDNGLLGGLFKKFFGEDSLIGHFIAAITGSTVGKGLKNMLSKITLKGIIQNIVGPALLLGGFSGEFDTLGARLGWGRQDNNTTTATTKSGETVTYDPSTGNYVTANGRIVSSSEIDTDSVKSRKTDRRSVSQGLMYNLGRGIITNTKNITSEVLGKTNIGKGIANTVGKIGSSIRGARAARSSDDTLEIMSAVPALYDEIAEAFSKIGHKLSKIPIVNKIDWDAIGSKFSVIIGNKLASESAESIAKLAANAVVWVKIAFCVIDYTTGYEDARSTMGIVDEPTIGQKVLSGCLRLVKNLIPIIGTFIPDNLIVDIFCDYVAPALGISVEELKAQRSKAQETVDAWNASHPNQKVNSITEYNKTVLKDYTWTERIGNAGRGIWAGTKAKFNSMKSGIKEKGLGGYLYSTISDMGTNFVKSYKSEGGGLAGIFSGIGTTFGNMLPGILGEITKANLDIKAKAAKGDIKGLWSITLSDFSGGKTTEDGITTAVPSLFSKIIGQIPLFLNKLVCTPFALVAKLVNPIVDFAKNTLEKIKSGVSFVIEQGKVGYDLAHDTNSTLDQLFDVPEVDAGPMSGLVKAGLITSRLVGVGVAILGRVGSNIGEKFGEFIDKVKGGWQKMGDNVDLVKAAAMTGDVNAVWDVNIDTDPENPVGGIYKASLVANKLWYTVPSIFVGIGNNISEWFEKKTYSIKEDNTSLTDKLSELKETATAGDLKDIWNAEYKASKENPIGFVYTIGFFIGKLFYSVASIFNTIMKPVKEVYDGVKEYTGNIITGVSEWAGEKVDAVKSGVTKVGQNIKTGAANAWNTASNLVDTAWDKVTSFVSGGSSGFVSQLDPRYSNMSIGNSTVGALGCGPASAVMALNQYSGNMANAVNVANSYQSAGGTDAAFFADYYARHGANASYYDGTSSAGKSNIINSISSGSPVVLMGRDFRNRSKANSPFGPNNHYVVASGFDGAGNLIINDPESSGTRKYSSKILNNVSLGIGINGGRSGLLRRFGLAGGSSYSHGLRVDNVTKAIWKFFRDNGFSEEATAGIMGNMQAESGIDPTRLQVGGPAKGIVQWEGGRFTNMVNYAQSKGRDWTDLMSQLEFVLMEMKDSRVTFWKSNAKYCNNIEEFKKLKNVQQATHDFEEAFERAGVKALEKRYQYASYYYQAFSGKTPAAYDTSITTGVPYGTSQIPSSGSSSTGSAVENAMKGFGILSTINSAFSKIGDIFNGSSDSTTGSNIVPFTSGDYTNYPSLPPTAGNGNAQSLIDIAASQLGVSQGAGQRTKYGQFTGTDGMAWCAAFVSWCMNEAFGGNVNKLNAALRGGKSASEKVLLNQFKNANAISSTPQPGDIALYNGHVGIVESVDGTKLTTIEGNTSGTDNNGVKWNNGGVVARKSWDYTDKNNWRTQRLNGFGRPDWLGAAAASGSGLVPMSSRRNQFRVATNNQTGVSHVGSRRAAGSSGISTDVAILLKSIIALVETLVKNTDRIDSIHEVLVAIAKSKGINDAATLAAINNATKSNDNSSIESSLSGLKAMVDNILAS